MLVKILGVNALLPMLLRLRFSKPFQSDNHVCYDLNNSTRLFYLPFKVSSQSRKFKFNVFNIIHLNGNNF